MNIWVRTSSSRTSSRTSSRNSSNSNNSLRPMNTVLPTITEQRRRLEDAEDSEGEKEMDYLKLSEQKSHQNQSSYGNMDNDIFRPLKFGQKAQESKTGEAKSGNSIKYKVNELSNKSNPYTQMTKKSVRFNFQQHQEDQYTENSKRPYQIDEDYEADTTSVAPSHYFIGNNPKMKLKKIKKDHLQSSKKQQYSEMQEFHLQHNTPYTFQKRSTSNPPQPTSNKLNSSSNRNKNSSSNSNLYSKIPFIASIRPRQSELQKTHSSSFNNIQKSIRSININQDHDQPQQQDWSILRSRRQTSAGKTTGRKQNIRQHIISIIQYCSNEVGMAIYNTNNGQIHLCQIIERMTYFRTISTIQRFYPLQIIYSFSLEHTPLIKKLNFKFRNITFKNFKRIIFDQTKGYNIYSQRGNKQDYNPDNKFISYSALNALIFYLQNNYQTKFNYNTLNIKWHLIQDLLIIQSQTILELQIFLNAQTKRKENCFIDNFHCLTYGGTRMLRANILQPLSNEKAIRERQDLVSILLEDKILYDILCGQVAKFKNFQIITAKFIQSPKQQNMKSLKAYIAAIYSLSHLCLLLKKFHQKIQPYLQKHLPLLSKLFSLLNDTKISQLRQNIESNFDEQILKMFDSNKPTKRQNFIFLFKIQKLEDDFIEVLRITYSHTMQDILKIFKTIKQKSGFDLKLLYNEFRGYYIRSNKRINLNNLSQKIQDDIIQISQKKDTITFSTTILVSLNNRLKQSQKKLILLSQNLLKNIIFQIQKNIDILFEINYQISVLDMVLSFVSFIKTYQAIKFTKPTIQKQSKNMVIEGLKTIWSNQAKLKISKDINLNINSDKNIVILQKSPNSFQQLNFLYSIGYLTILTQIGCFVPAAKFTTDLYHTILSKINLSENIESNLSHFQTELYHFKNIIDNSAHHRNNCLILLDQFVKGTQYEQQISISLALISHLLNIKGKTFALISDKFQLNLTRKISSVPSLLNSQAYQESDDQLIKKISKNKTSEPSSKKNQQRCPIHFELIQGENNLQQTMQQLNFAPQFLHSFKTLIVQDQHKSLPF